MIKFEIFPARNQERRLRWYWRIRSALNGEPLGQSEGYSRKADCRKTVDLIRREAGDAPVEVLDSVTD